MVKSASFSSEGNKVGFALVLGHLLGIINMDAVGWSEKYGSKLIDEAMEGQETDLDYTEQSLNDLLDKMKQQNSLPASSWMSCILGSNISAFAWDFRWTWNTFHQI